MAIIKKTTAIYLVKHCLSIKKECNKKFHYTETKITVLVKIISYCLDHDRRPFHFCNTCFSAYEVYSKSRYIFGFNILLQILSLDSTKFVNT
ncbi:hypothetical protein BpHYR1_012577 [Brachionus plicatilis]|uniref:Uncharacterized protein n=1 Tax=Brachionus plicatilis TaxID=10195 RepID=A0A3M7QRK2_BRAPC|nr:hypothetical protein BpHYR1_012577 [Brachionus plicatilis]